LLGQNKIVLLICAVSYIVERRGLLQAKVDGFEIDGIVGGGHLPVGAVHSPVPVYQADTPA
jgi:hypothetical protein